MNIFLESLGIFLVTSQIFRFLFDLIDVVDCWKNNRKRDLESFSYMIIFSIGIILIKNF